MNYFLYFLITLWNLLYGLEIGRQTCNAKKSIKIDVEAVIDLDITFVFLVNQHGLIV